MSRLQRQASTKDPSSSQFSVANKSNYDDTTANTSSNDVTSIKSTNHTDGTDRIQHLRDTFMLDDNDLQDIHQAFCYMAKTKLSQSTTAAKSKQIKKKTRRQKAWEIPDDTVTLSLSDFFATFQPAERTNNGGYFDSIFDLTGTKDLHAMTYTEFVEGMCTFCTFKFDDLIRFIFFILDKEKSGLIPRFQLLRFVESIHGGKKIQIFEKAILPKSAIDIADANDIPSVSSSPQKTTCTTIHLPTAERQRSSVNYQQLKQLCIDYPTLLEPMLLFQSKLRRRIMGEVWWRKKESMIIKEQHRILTLEKKEGTNDEESKQKGIKKMKISIGGLFRRVLSFDMRSMWKK